MDIKKFHEINLTNVGSIYNGLRRKLLKIDMIYFVFIERATQTETAIPGPPLNGVLT
jgi:hypothetical protein